MIGDPLTSLVGCQRTIQELAGLPTGFADDATEGAATKAITSNKATFRQLDGADDKRGVTYRA
jgi:hypothetical protein